MHRVIRRHTFIFSRHANHAGRVVIVSRTFPVILSLQSSLKILFEPIETIKPADNEIEHKTPCDLEIDVLLVCETAATSYMSIKRSQNI